LDATVVVDEVVERAVLVDGIGVVVVVVADVDESVVSVVGTEVVVDAEETVAVDGLAVDVLLVGATVLEDVVG